MHAPLDRRFYAMNGVKHVYPTFFIFNVSLPTIRQVGKIEFIPTGEREKMLEEEGAGEGVIQGVVGLAAGREAREFGREAKRGNHVLERLGRELRIRLADKPQGVNPLKRMKRRDVVEKVALGGDVVRDEDAVLEPQKKVGPEVVRRGRGGEFGAELRVPAGRGGIERAVRRDAQEGFVRRGREEVLATSLNEADLPRFVGMARDVAGGLEIERDPIHGFTARVTQYDGMPSAMDSGLLL